MRNVVQTRPMSKILYRAARVARALGEPSRYKIITVPPVSSAGLSNHTSSEVFSDP